ncbi:MFS transporter [Leekyejoonella antrihumi]|uniref:MFS transporter n=1 Tax=Leekyejoonella antrihumi TaxID=1660198 RepID=A0A563E3E9_9MICO|nr:MFS transporter [Leekyejoonella antrihumi]
MTATAGRLTASAGRWTYRGARRATQAEGAGESGLSRLIEVHAFSSAGDVAVTIGLAGTVFFAASSGSAARSSVLLFLLLTMLPFALVAPLIGPLLDRFSRGRRWAIGGTLAARGFLCWVLAETVEDHSSWLFPIALSILILSKAYLVTRSAAAPRLLPKQLTLVKANGRLSLAGVVGASVAGVLAGGAAKLGGSAWALRVAFVLFVVGAILAVLLPAQVDNTTGEDTSPVGLTTGRRGRRGPTIAPDVVSALRANSGLRWLSGFLTIFLAFLMRIHPFPGWEDRKTLLLALVVGAAGVGNALGTVMGSLLKIASPRVVVLATLLADAVMAVVAAIFFGLWTAVAVGLVAGVCQQLGKLALDSLIQDTVPEGSRTSVFGRSETLLQLSWVIGGIIAVTIPVNATLGMILAAVLLALWATVVLIWHTGHQLPVPERVRHAGPRPGAARRQRHSGAGPGTQAPPADPRSASPRPADSQCGSQTVPIASDEEETIGISRAEVHRQPGHHPDDDRRARWEERFRDEDR